jgi:hypothetical protein
MSDPHKDWLEEQLANLGDLEAPPTLLPKVMERVRARDRKPRLFGSPADLGRSFLLALSACLLAAILVVNPVRYFSELPLGVFLRTIDILLESAKVLLLQTEIYHWPLVTLFAPLVIFSYAFVLTAASLVQRLLALRK